MCCPCFEAMIGSYVIVSAVRIFKTKLHECTSYIYKAWLGSLSNSIPPTLVVRHSRWPALILCWSVPHHCVFCTVAVLHTCQALKLQTLRCPFHNTPEDKLHLGWDHSCGRRMLPQVYIILFNAEQVKTCSFCACMLWLRLPCLYVIWFICKFQ